MKKCIYQGKYGNKIRCKGTGSVRCECDIKRCRRFRPTLLYRLFGKWYEELR